MQPGTPVPGVRRGQIAPPDQQAQKMTKRTRPTDPNRAQPKVYYTNGNQQVSVPRFQGQDKAQKMIPQQRIT